MITPASPWIGSIRKHLEAGREGAEAGARHRVGREPDDAQRAAVEVVGGDDDLGLAVGHALDLVAPFAHRLDGALDRLGARVHRQDLVAAGQLCDLLVEQRQLVVAKGP
jgi:hypothetical protein